MAACVDGDVTPLQLTPLLDHFRAQLTLNPVFFTDPIRSIWVKSLAALIEPRLCPPARAAVKSSAPRSLAAVMIAEMQISLITHWLTGAYQLDAECVAEIFIANTRAMLSSMQALP